MGEFLLRQVDQRTGETIAAFALPNFIADEAIEHVYRQIFPPFQAAMTFVLGFAGPDTSGPNNRPQSAGGGANADKSLTWAQCTNADSNEGGGYTAAMRSSFGYARCNAAFSASNLADGGFFESHECTFPNTHAWTPQDKAAWDNPDTPEDIERPPPEWFGRHFPDPIVGFPWQWPRKLCGDVGTPPNHHESYMSQWDAAGGLDWLCDFRRIGGFPVTLAFLGDSSRNKIVAVGRCRRPILLWPGTTLYVSYRARLFSVDPYVTGAFAERYAKYAFEKTGTRYSIIYVRPVLNTLPTPSRKTTYADVETHFHAHFAAVALTNWTYVGAADPKRVESNAAPQWANSSGSTLGPFHWLAVYGLVSGVEELMWLTKLDPLVSVQNGDTLRVPNKVRFWFEGI